MHADVVAMVGYTMDPHVWAFNQTLFRAFMAKRVTKLQNHVQLQITNVKLGGAEKFAWVALKKANVFMR